MLFLTLPKYWIIALENWLGGVFIFVSIAFIPQRRIESKDFYFRVPHSYEIGRFLSARAGNYVWIGKSKSCLGKKLLWNTLKTIFSYILDIGVEIEETSFSGWSDLSICLRFILGKKLQERVKQSNEGPEVKRAPKPDTQNPRLVSLPLTLYVKNSWQIPLSAASLAATELPPTMYSGEK